MKYSQQSNQGCLAVDLMYLFDISPTLEKEKKILSEGLFRLRENYTLGCVLAFLDMYPGKKIKLYVDNKYYLNQLRSWVDHPNVSLVYQKNDKKLLDSLEVPFIVYVDNNIFDGWTHLPHFVLVTGSTESFYDVFDPWKGESFKMSKVKILKGVELLRNHIRICPFVITEDSDR